MKTLQIYDPAMCCSTGVCGPSVDEQLVELVAFLKGLDGDNVAVERYNLSQEPGAFVTNPAVKKILDEQGVDALPVVFVDGALVSSGKYPSITELSSILSVDTVTVKATNTCCGGGSC